MPDAIQELSGKLGIDTSDFKVALAAANRELRVLETGFRASAAGLADWTKDASGLESRITSLTSKIDLQRAKVAALQQEYTRIAAEKGVTSRAAQDLQIKLNQETESLNKMGLELTQSQAALKTVGQEHKNTGDKTKNLKDRQDEATSAAERMGAALRGLGSVAGSVAGGIGRLAAGVAKTATGLVVGLAGGAAAAGAGIVALITRTAATADELDELSQKTGLSTTRLQELQYISGQSGTEMEAMTGSLARLTRNMAAAQFGGGPAAAAFRTLGIHVKDASGNLRDNADVMFEALGALGKVGNETKRDALAMAIFGKTAQELNPLILAGADGLKSMSDEAHRMGAVMSAENIRAAADLNDQIGGLKAGAQGLAMTLASALIPSISGGVGVISGFVKKLASIMNIMPVNQHAGQLMIQQLVTDITSAVPGLLQTGLSILQSIFAGVSGALPALLPVAVSIVSSLISFLTDSLPGFIAAGVQIVTALVDGILPQLPMLVTAALGAVQTLITGLTKAAPQLLRGGLVILQGLLQAVLSMLPLLLPLAIQLVTSLVDFLVQALPGLMLAGAQILMALVNGILPQLPALLTAALQILMTLAQGLIQALPVLIPAIAQIIPQLVLILTQNLPLLLTLAIQLINALALGILQALPILIASAPQILGAIITALLTAAPMLLDAARQLNDTLYNGLVASLNALAPIGQMALNALQNAFNSIAAGLKKIGKEIVMGIWAGIEAARAFFIGQVLAFFSSIIKMVKQNLGIASPSTVFAGIGENMALGLGVGFAGAMEGIRRQVADQVRQISGNVTVTGAAGGAGEKRGPAKIEVNLAIDKVIANDTEDVANLARRVAEEILNRTRS